MNAVAKASPSLVGSAMPKWVRNPCGVGAWNQTKKTSRGHPVDHFVGGAGRVQRMRVSAAEQPLRPSAGREGVSLRVDLTSVRLLAGRNRGSLRVRFCRLSPVVRLRPLAGQTWDLALLVVALPREQEERKSLDPKPAAIRLLSAHNQGAVAFALEGLPTLLAAAGPGGGGIGLKNPQSKEDAARRAHGRRTSFFLFVPRLFVPQSLSRWSVLSFFLSGPLRSGAPRAVGEVEEHGQIHHAWPRASDSHLSSIRVLQKVGEV